VTFADRPLDESSTAGSLAGSGSVSTFIPGWSDRDDLASERRAGPFDPGVGGEQCGSAPLGGSDVYRIGVAQ
jgi:hypothetical protein